jgi:hypothetical protein
MTFSLNCEKLMLFSRINSIIKSDEGLAFRFCFVFNLELWGFCCEICSLQIYEGLGEIIFCLGYCCRIIKKLIAVCGDFDKDWFFAWSWRWDGDSVSLSLTFKIRFSLDSSIFDVQKSM